MRKLCARLNGSLVTVWSSQHQDGKEQKIWLCITDSMCLKQATFLFFAIFSFCNYLQVKKSVKETEKSNDDEDSDEWEFEDKSLSEILIEVVSISTIFWFGCFLPIGT